MGSFWLSRSFVNRRHSMLDMESSVFVFKLFTYVFKSLDSDLRRHDALISYTRFKRPNLDEDKRAVRRECKAKNCFEPECTLKYMRI